MFAIKVLSVSLVITLVYQKTSAAGDDCTSNDDCTGTNAVCHMWSECSKGRCGCSDGFKKVNGTCITEVMLGEACTSVEQCGMHALCTSSVCACDVTFKSVDSKFCIPRGAGESCGASANCTEFLGVTCQSGTCACYNSSLTEQESSYYGQTIKVCTLKNGKSRSKNKGSCKTNVKSTDDDYQSCEKGQRCDMCPSESTSKCIKDGAVTVSAGLATVFFLPILAIMM